MKINGYHPNNGAHLGELNESVANGTLRPASLPREHNVIEDIFQLEELLSRPTPGVLEAFSKIDGDIMILGVGGKMGPTLARMAHRAFAELGRRDKVIGVARFSNRAARHELEEQGVETVRCDLLQQDELAQLPDAPNVIFMAGHKFGASASPELTWAMNTLVPAYVAQRYARSRIVAFSTGCVYPLVSIRGSGSREEDPLGPPGDYANSCVGRERLMSYFANQNSTPLSIVRLNYAIDLRYGVLLDVAQKVWKDQPVDVTMGYANVIWQGDANAQVLQCLSHASAPPFILNLTGPETISIRALAQRFGEILGREPRIVGTEADTAWLNNAGKAQRLFGYPNISLEQMIDWTAHWLKNGGDTLNKPTHFEARDGHF